MPADWKFNIKNGSLCNTNTGMGKHINPEKYSDITYSPTESLASGTLYTVKFFSLDFWGRKTVTEELHNVLLFDGADIDRKFGLLDHNPLK